jgi:lysophospholipase L1-like esterase
MTDDRQQILVYSDSLTWGIVPGTRQRFSFALRWPGVMERQLLAAGQNVRVIEDCLNGRRTVWEDPFKAGRNGRVGLEQRIEINSPLALVMVMLGTNDFQSMHAFTAWHSAQGMASLIAAIRNAPIEPGMPVPRILIVAPPTLQTPKGAIAPKFVGCTEKAAGLADAYQTVARDAGCAFFDAGSVTPTSTVDGVHLDADQHLRLGSALATYVADLLRDVAIGEQADPV